MRRAALALALCACTNASLFGDRRSNPPDETKVTGSVCTSDPAEQAFPVRVLFLVDTSIDDAVYINQRADAIEKVVRSFPGPNYAYALIRYAGPQAGTPCGLSSLTPDGFGKNVEEAIAGLRCTDAQNPGRDIQGALSLASAFVSGDVLKTPLGTRSRTKYVIVLFANGAPTVSLPQMWCRTRGIPDRDCEANYEGAFCADLEPPPEDCERYQYTRVVRETRDFALEHGAQEFFFHTVYQRDPDLYAAGSDDRAAVALFRDLSLNGLGAFFRVTGPARCDNEAGDTAGCMFNVIDFDSTQSVLERRQLLVSNRSALATGRGLLPDTDQDGLDDETEQNLGTDPVRRDTDGDTLSDRVELLLSSSGLDPRRDELADTSSTSRWPIECPRPGSGNPRAFPPDRDRDGDGLTDCEEALLRSDPTLFDSDADGLPDALELRYGTNLIAHDLLEDHDADGLANLEELKFHLAPTARDPSTDRSYRYEIRGEGRREVVSFTQPIALPGVTVLGVSPASTDGRATLWYEPQDHTLSYRDPQDTSPSGATPGRGARVIVSGDGEYTLHSAASSPEQADPISIRLEVIAELLPELPTRADLRLRRSTRVCFDFTVEGVQLLETLPQPDTGLANVNFIDVFLAEVPSNNPNSYGVFRAATVPIVLTPNVPAEDIVLADEDFLLFGE